MEMLLITKGIFAAKLLTRSSDACAGVRDGEIFLGVLLRAAARSSSATQAASSSGDSFRRCGFSPSLCWPAELFWEFGAYLVHADRLRGDAQDVAWSVVVHQRDTIRVSLAFLHWQSVAGKV